MNEQINVLKPYDVVRRDLQSLFRTVDWLQDSYKRHVFDTKKFKSAIILFSQKTERYI